MVSVYYHYARLSNYSDLTNDFTGWSDRQLWQPLVQRLPTQDGGWNFDFCCRPHGEENPHAQLDAVVLEER